MCREFFAATITLLLLLLESSKSLLPLLLHALSFLSLFACSWSSLNLLPLLLHAFPFLVTLGMQRCSWNSLNLLPLLLHALPFLVTLCMQRCHLLQASPDFNFFGDAQSDPHLSHISWPHFTIARFHIAGLHQT